MILKIGCIAYWQIQLHNWNGFVRAFLRTYFPKSKTVKLRNEINQFMQADRESFWKFLICLRKLLFQCPYHGLDQACLSQIIYDQQTRTMVELTCQGGFLS